METKVFCIYILLGILFDIIDLIYHYNECKEITLRDILLCPFFIIIWPIPTFLLLIESAGDIKILKKKLYQTMKEITCIQQYVIDNLINNKTLSIENLIDAIVKTCSTEQFDNILTVLIKTQTSCTNKDKVNFVKMNMYISKEVGNETKIQIIKILREQFNTISLSLKEAKDYIDSCIGEYNIFPKVVTQEKINELIRKLEPYNVSISTIKLMQQKYCAL